MDAATREDLERELANARRRLAEAEQLARMGSWEWDIPGNRVLWSDELYRLYGHEPGAFEPTYERFIEHVHPDDRDSVDERNQKAFADHQPFEDVKRVVRADGQVFLMRTQGEVVEDADGNPIRMIGVCEDVTAEQRAAEAASRLEAIVSSSADAIVGLDRRGLVTIWNHAAERLLGWQAVEVLGAGLDADEDGGLPAVVARALSGERLDAVDLRISRRDDETIDVAVSASPVRDPEERIVGVSLVVRDVSERRRLEQRLQWLADHDALTGLPNRRRLDDELRTACARARTFGERAALMVADLDGFKWINDTAGHGAGDQLLRGVASAMRGRLRSTDVLARLGGDEFAVLCPGADEAAARAIAADLLDTVRTHTTVISGHSITSTASIGCVLVTENASADSLLAAADRAMYDAKDAGRDRIVVHDAAHSSVPLAPGRLDWEARIRGALAADGFELHGQPIVDARTGAVDHVELLLRMRADGGLVAPGAFLPVAERLGLIHAIDAWVAEQAVALLARHPGSAVAVNLSARSIGDEQVAGALERALARHAIDPSRLTLEITETAAIANMDEARRFADRLTAHGCRLALDDFGTGFGSFTYLKHLPVHELKIDGDFVRGPASPADASIVASIVAVARALGIRTTAEWVADEDAVARMRAAGVDLLQGYAVGAPAPAAEVLSITRRRTTSDVVTVSDPSNHHYRGRS